MWNEKKSTNVADKIPAVSADGRESGQIMVSLLLMLAIFLLAMVGFAVDLTNLWFHRQAAQTAADSACQAGALDMAALAAGLALPKMGFTPGTSADCTSGAGTICFYANVNGYNGAGLSSNSASNSVTWSFPTSVPRVTTPSWFDHFLSVPEGCSNGECKDALSVHDSWDGVSESFRRLHLRNYAN